MGKAGEGNLEKLGPDQWERVLFTIWDRVDSIRLYQGKQVAAEVARRALAAIENAEPASAEHSDRERAAAG